MTITGLSPVFYFLLYCQTFKNLSNRVMFIFQVR